MQGKNDLLGALMDLLSLMSNIFKNNPVILLLYISLFNYTPFNKFIVKRRKYRHVEKTHLCNMMRRQYLYPGVSHLRSFSFIPSGGLFKRPQRRFTVMF